MAHSPKSVRHLLKDKPTLKRLDAEIRAQSALLAIVRRHLPGDLARHCVAARCDGERLVLHTDSPVWASRLRFLSAELRSLLKTDIATLREVKVRLSPARTVAPRPRRPARRSARGAEIVGESAEHTPSAALGEALARLARRLKPHQDQ